MQKNMGKRILLFNIVYYAVLLIFVQLSREHPSESLGYVFFVVAFWVVAGIVLAFFLRRRIIWPQTFLQGLGVFAATPILTLAVGWLIAAVNHLL